jgi:tRNA threonylcarbamoyladenosine biosynthesis protein TsaB
VDSRRWGRGAVLILGVTTSTLQVGCAIGGHEGVLASVHSSRGKRHAETLAPAIDFLHRQARVDLDEIGCVAVDVGPGLFTGLRVGIATAKAMAHALRVPMIGVVSLDLAAFPVRWSPRLIVAAIDARRGELFSATYRQVPGGIQRLGEYQVGSPDDLAGDIAATGQDVLLVGDGARRYTDTFAAIGPVEVADQSMSYPSAASLVQLAHARALREEFVQPWQLEPVYLRRPDAEINWITRDGKIDERTVGGTPSAGGPVSGGDGR